LNYELIELKGPDISRDERGVLWEFLRGEELENKLFGQINFMTINPGYVRGRHYHQRKDEWFMVIRGRCKVLLVDVNTGERREIILDSEDAARKLRIGSYLAHVFKNIGESPVLILEYSNEAYNRENPDTLRYGLEV
jgi:dTDP-4-dehydrorhamnose 3,5-epimerase-like enzyme